MNIDGMSEATLEFLIFSGWVNSYIDLYSLDKQKFEWIRTEGYGKSTLTNLLESIENSRRVKLENFLVGLGIPLIGRTASKDISKFCNGFICEFIEYLESDFDFSTAIVGFGDTMNISLYGWFNNNKELFMSLLEEVTIVRDEVIEINSKSLNGSTFVITGSVNHFKNRDELKAKIESHNGKVSGSVSAKTNYLINNDITSSSGKNKDAKKLNVPIITEEQFLEMIK